MSSDIDKLAWGSGAGVDTLIERIAEKLGVTVKASTIFGEPVERDGLTVIPVANPAGFIPGQAITIDSGANLENALVVSSAAGGRAGQSPSVTVAAPLARPHAAGVQISGSGITIISGLTRAHAIDAQVTANVPTPGAPNQKNQ